MAEFTRERGLLLLSLARMYANILERESGEPRNWAKAVEETLKTWGFDSEEEYAQATHFLLSTLAYEGSRIAAWQPRPFKTDPVPQHLPINKKRKRFPRVRSVDREVRRVEVELSESIWVRFQIPGRHRKATWGSLQENWFSAKDRLFENVEVHKDPLYRKAKIIALAILDGK